MYVSWGALASLILAVIATACSSGHRAARLAPTTTTVATTATLAPTSAPTMVTATACRSDQIVTFLRGIQGIGGGQLGASYWTYNPSLSSCALPKSLTVELLDAGGISVATATSSTPGEVLLPGNTPVPGPGNPAPNTVAYMVVGYTPINEPGGGGPCPTPTVVPTSLRFRFSGLTPIETSAVSAGSRRIEVCQGALTVFSVGLI